MKKYILTIATIIGMANHIDAQNLAYAILDINQATTTLNSNGGLFANNTTGALFEIPAGGGRHTIYAGAVWIGGLDTTGGLHVAGQTYRQTGIDFFAGPVMDSSNYSPALDAQWDQVWKINKTSIDSFLLNNQTPIPGYVIPSAINNWPGNGDLLLGQAAQLAPYIDTDADGVYNPSAGDYPCIKGDQALFAIFNDDRGVHTESDGAKFTFEFHAMMYAYSAPGTWLDSIVFINYKLYNRSASKYSDLYWGNWTDYDLGYAFDDYIGCDVDRHIGYVTNADSADGSSATPGPTTYGINPPAQGMIMLRGPEAPLNDGVDNNRNWTVDEANEVCRMSHFMSYTNDFSVNGNPEAPIDYYNYLQAKWKDSSAVTYGGTGYGGTIPSEVIFPGNTDLNSWCTNSVPQAPWDEYSSNNDPGDRRGIVSSGPFELISGQEMCIDVALVYGRGTNGPLSSISAMQNAADSVNIFYLQNNPCTCDENPLGVNSTESETISIYPNPARESINIICGENSVGSTVEVIDMHGKVVVQTTVLSGNSVAINTTNLTSGVYFVRVNNGSVVLTSKFVRQ